MPASWTLPALPGQVVVARHLVGDFATGHGADAETLHTVHLVVSEAVTNAVLHAYRDHRAPGDVHLSVEEDDGRLRLVVADDGIGPVSRTDSPGLGLGLPLLGQLCERLDVRRRAGGGTELVVEIALR